MHSGLIIRSKLRSVRHGHEVVLGHVGRRRLFRSDPALSRMTALPIERTRILEATVLMFSERHHDVLTVRQCQLFSPGESFCFRMSGGRIFIAFQVVENRIFFCRKSEDRDAITDI